MNKENTLNESRFKKVVRDGKIVKKLKCKDGYKAQDGKCVKISATESRTRAKAAKKAARSRKGKKTQSNRARTISNKIRKQRNL